MSKPADVGHKLSLWAKGNISVNKGMEVGGRESAMLKFILEVSPKTHRKK